jgi:F-type H+-transporting ATPase subunit delta
MAGDTTTVARPYAEAAFAVAKADKALDDWAEGLELLAAIAADPAIADRLGNPNVPREEMQSLLFAIADAQRAKALPQGLQNLVRLLTENKRLPVLPELARLFDELKQAEQGVRHIAVRSAFALSDAEQAELAKSLKAHFGADVELTIEDDPALIGGVEVRADDMVIDGSIRGRLQQLSNELQF